MISSIMLDHSACEKFCEQVFKLNKGIRYVGIFNGDNAFFKMREGVKNLLTQEQTMWSLKDTLARWKTRNTLSSELGKPLYAMAEYEKVKRVTVPIDENSFILISMERAVYHEIITKEILDLRDTYFKE